MFCPNCGNQCKDGTRYCYKCHTTIVREKVDKEKDVDINDLIEKIIKFITNCWERFEELPQKMKRCWIFGILGAICFCVIIGSVFNQNGDVSEDINVETEQNIEQNEVLPEITEEEILESVVNPEVVEETETTVSVQYDEERFEIIEVEYGDNGEIIHTVVKDADGNLMQKEYTYHANGTIKSRKKIHSDGGFNLVEYDAKGTQIRRCFSWAEDVIRDICYDPRTDVYVYTVKDRNGNTRTRIDYELDDNGRIYKERRYNADGSLAEETIWEPAYYAFNIGWDREF